MADDRLAQILAGSGGIGSDARMPVAPVQRDPKMERLIQVMAMSGRQPTPEMDAYLRAIAPEKEERGGRLGTLGAELTGIPQIGRAGTAIGEAVQEPSIPNVTNAGVQTSLAALRPAAALKTLGGGYLAAILSDSGAFDMGAEAQSKKAPKATLPGLSQEQQAEYDAAQRRLASGDFSGSAERRQIEKTVEDLRRASIDFQRANADSERRLRETAETSKQGEYNRQIEAAEAARDREKSRDVRFADTTTGKLYNKTAGVTPFLFATGTGALTRAAMKPSTMSNYTLPMSAGALEGIVAANLPLAADAYLTSPALNPEREANRAYARELPPAHPRRQEFMDYANSLPEENPTRTLAAKELYDPWKLAERSGIGAAEGVAGGFVGAKIPQMAGRMYEGAKSGASRLVEVLTGRRQPSQSTMPGLGGDIPTGAGAASPRPTAGTASSGPTLPQTATGPNSELAQTLAQGQQRGLSSLASSDDLLRALRQPRQALPEPPRPAPLPPGMAYDVNGRVYNTHTGHPVKKELLTGREAPPKKRSSSKTDEPEKSVQVDDTRPLRYPSED